MIFRRSIMEKLHAWKQECQGRKALLLEGARRIGKSTIVQEFGKQSYKSCLVIDFNDASKNVLSFFANHLNELDTFFLLLSTECNTPLYPRESLIVFDEVQKYPLARQAIKRLVADGRFDYIETGSLISIHENVKDITIPSEERHLKMYPMSFEEFCHALDAESLFSYLRRCFDESSFVEEGLHYKAMLLFRQYMLTGGMPRSVAAYLENGRSFKAADAEKRDILALYRSDIMKIGRRYRSKVLAVFDQLPGFLSRHEKKVVFKELQPNGNYNAYEDTFFWLSDAMISNECFRCDDPQMGLSLHENRTSLKCYFGDTGLLISHTFSDAELEQEQLYKEILSGKIAVNQGMFYENMIAQMLVANGHKLFFYSNYNPQKHRSDMEVDFLISNYSKLRHRISPVEVKSGRNYSILSLERFLQQFKDQCDIAYVLHPKNLRQDGKILYLPAYMACFL
ncbi:MAG: AAA family ATPase [Lentisphaeria bacterium]|nr:AAA family ATPase [Lentisphaeria bacterium]